MSLYKALLIDIIYSLREDHLDNEQAESKQLDMDRYNLATNYQIVQSLIDIIFEILKDQPIKFDPNLRSRQDFLHAKEQIASLDTTIESDGFNPAITKEEGLEIGNPKIRGIILDQELVPLNSDHEQSILFIHLMFLSFREIRQINSMMVKRKYVLLKMFEQSTYSYKCQGQDYRFRQEPNIQNHIHDVQNDSRPKDQIMISQCIGKQSIQDLSKISDQSMNQQCQQSLNQEQTDPKAQMQLHELRKMAKINSIQFYFRSNYPIQIEQLSSHKIKMTFSKIKQSVYRWPQLDRSSYTTLMTTHPKAFHCWTSMLKLLNQKQFQAFINDQFGDSESDDEIVNDVYQIDELLINNHLQLDNIVRIDNRQSIVKFRNIVMIIEQFKIQRNLQLIEQQVETVNNLCMKQNYLDREIERLKKQFQITSTLEEWHDKQKQLVSSIPCNEAQCIMKAQPTLLQEQQNTIPEPNNNRVVYIDKAIQTSFNQSTDNKQNIVQDDQIRLDQKANQQDNNFRARQLMPAICPIVKNGVIYHSGQWKFGKQYPVQIERLTNSRLLMKMKDNKMIMVEWWQFDYESLKSFEKVSLKVAQTWNVLLILIDEAQFFKLWKGEVIEQISIKGEEEQQQNTIQVPGQYHLTQLPERIVGNDYYRFIVKFRNCVKIFKKVELSQCLIQKYEQTNEKIVLRQAFFNSKIKIFKDILLEQGKQKTKSQQYQGTHEYKSVLKVTIDPQLHTGKWIFNEYYPLRIHQIDKDSLKIEFRHKIKNTTVRWEQLDYHSLIQLIDERINIRAGRVWSIMLILLDHDQFYKIWKDYHCRNSKLRTQADDRQAENNQQAVTINKRDTLDYMPQRLIRLDELRVIVKFQNYVQVFPNDEFAQYGITMEIPEAEVNKLKINALQYSYNQNIKAFQERLRLEQDQEEESN